jgi:hypothetical protein
MAKSKRKPEHYVNNRDFTEAVSVYARQVKEAEAKGEEPPVIPTYIGDCFIRLAEGLAHKHSYYGYTYREEMVSDGIENCVKAAAKFNPEAPTRSGKPNAFGYFTQIIAWAFHRRIAREKKQTEIKEKLIDNSDISDYADSENLNENQHNQFIERMKHRRE